jgi:hypothetical protein
MVTKILIAKNGDAQRGRAAILSTRDVRAAHERELAAEH